MFVVPENLTFLFQELVPDLSNVRLTTTYPKREYTSEDHSKSLRELSLTPNASIIVSPVSDQQTNRLLSSRIFLLIYINLSVPMSFIPNMTMCSNYSPSYRQNH